MYDPLNPPPPPPSVDEHSRLMRKEQELADRDANDPGWVRRDLRAQERAVCVDGLRGDTLTPAERRYHLKWYAELTGEDRQE